MALHTVFRQGVTGFIDKGTDIWKQIEKQFLMVQELCEKLEKGEKTGWKNDRFENVIFRTRRVNDTAEIRAQSVEK